MRLTPQRGGLALDVGARDGFFSRLLAQRFDRVVALDLERPAFVHPGIECVAGDATALEFPDGYFDFVFCAEVLEHIPMSALPAACREMVRVCRGQLLIGVPDRQDLRVGRTTCQACGGRNPPWGHVNSFDRERLCELFAGCAVMEASGVGFSDESTNDLSAWLMDLAGNPYGTYGQEEPCIHCGSALGRPPERGFMQKALTKLGFWARAATASSSVRRSSWIHLLFSKATVD